MRTILLRSRQDCLCKGNRRISSCGLTRSQVRSSRPKLTVFWLFWKITAGKSKDKIGVQQEGRISEAVNSLVHQREFTRVATSARSLIGDTGILRSTVSYLIICSHGKYVKHLQHRL